MVDLFGDHMKVLEEAGIIVRDKGYHVFFDKNGNPAAYVESGTPLTRKQKRIVANGESRFVTFSNGANEWRLYGPPEMFKE